MKQTKKTAHFLSPLFFILQFISFRVPCISSVQFSTLYHRPPSDGCERGRCYQNEELAFLLPLGREALRPRVSDRGVHGRRVFLSHVSGCLCTRALFYVYSFFWCAWMWVSARANIVCTQGRCLQHMYFSSSLLHECGLYHVKMIFVYMSVGSVQDKWLRVQRRVLTFINIFVYKRAVLLCVDMFCVYWFIVYWFCNVNIHTFCHL